MRKILILFVTIFSIGLMACGDDITNYFFSTGDECGSIYCVDGKLVQPDLVVAADVGHLVLSGQTDPADLEGKTIVRFTNALPYELPEPVTIKTFDRFQFKDLSRSGSNVLLPYEDWRLPVWERAMDLASRLSVNQLASQLFAGGMAIPNTAAASSDADTNTFEFNHTVANFANTIIEFLGGTL